MNFSRSNLVWGLGAIVGIAGYASGAASAPEPGLMTVPVAGGLYLFDVRDLGAARSDAARVEPGGQGKRGSERTEGWGFTAQIAVKTDDRAGLERIIKRNSGRGVWVRPAEGVEGFVIVEAPTVRVAVKIAQRLWVSGAYESVEMVTEHPRSLRGPIGDLLDEQWHLRNFDNPIADVNAMGAWDLGYTGSGVVIGIVEGGFEESHPDLAPNFVPLATIPTVNQTRHSTSVAGVAAARGDTTDGGAGVAYEAGLASQYYGKTSESTATALGFAKDLTDIKSNSWGPLDLRRLEPIPAIEMNAIIDAATTGRGGLGTVFVWAAGNGGEQDRVDYDSWASSRYTIAVGAIGFDDAEPIYNELGSSMFVVAQSDGGGQKITTTDLTGAAGYDPGDYTNNFGGTSASCPLAAGTVALALEANPGLTRRDVMHLLVETARKNDPSDSYWMVNGVGHDISERFGFGAIDAGALVTAALSWENVTPEVSKSSGVISVEQVLPDDNATGVTSMAVMPSGLTIESVELVLNATSEFMGDVEIILTSPSGTLSPLARKRPDATTDVVDFVFTSFRHWGEDSGGNWTVRLADRAGVDLTTWHDFELRIYGTQCLADTNGDGVIDNGDITMFVDAFLDPEVMMDLNGDGIEDNGDIGVFVDAFLGGC